MDCETWMTPAQAERLVSGYSEVEGLAGPRNRLLTWIGDGNLRVMALEVTRWLAKEDEDQYPLTPKQSLDPSKVQPLGKPMFYEQLPLLPRTSHNYLLQLKDWQAASASSGASWDKMFTDSRLAHDLPRERNPNSWVAYDGLRMCADDIARRIEIAGWSKPEQTSAASQARADGPSPNTSIAHPEVNYSPKGKPMTHDHSYAAAVVALTLVQLPKSERARLTGPSVGAELQPHYLSRGGKSPHVDALDDFGASVLLALQDHWQNSNS